MQTCGLGVTSVESWVRIQEPLKIRREVARMLNLSRLTLFTLAWLQYNVEMGKPANPSKREDCQRMPDEEYQLKMQEELCF
ncbi:hypothetical protein TNCV_2623131 [Trichonephila clavipes]|nr:hypothetical protein TNCV_2623131 [Trichonephila clavipes]